MSHSHDSNGLSRRKFIKLGAAGVVAARLGGMPGRAFADEVPAQPKLPKRRYGRTGLEISALVGASDWNKDVIPYAVDAGVNYWHKAHAWGANIPDAIKKQPRESYYLEVVVDRVGGDNMHGRIDEDQHYQFVKQCIERSGLGYFDVFKFHFGYHSIQEAKTELGMVNAYQRLKKEGLVKHLTLSQHHYNSLDGGNMAYEIIAYLMDNSPYEAAQFFYTYNDKKEINDIIDLAKKKDFGVIAMKTMGGVGRAAQDPKFQALLADPKYKDSKPGAALVKWLMSNPSLTAAVIATKNLDQWQENSDAAAHSAMAAADHHALSLLASYNKGLTCLLCADCVSHCPEHIAIADILRYERYAHDYHDLPRARADYAALTKNGTACVACGDCLSSCPSEIHIADKMKEVHRLLS